MRILACYLPATCGDVRVVGRDVFRDSVEVRRRIGYLPENVPLYHEMRVAEYLVFRASLKGLRGSHRRRRIDWALANCSLTEVRDRIIGNLSKGYRQRVGIADALVHDPDLLILDEPTLGLDPNQIRLIRGLIRKLARRHTILLSSHILSEVEMVCDRVLIMNKGAIAGQGTPEELSGILRGHTCVALEVRAAPDAVHPALSSVPGVLRVTAEPLTGEWTRAVCECEKGREVRASLFHAVVAAGWPMRELHEQRQSLEDVFVQVTGGAP